MSRKRHRARRFHDFASAVLSAGSHAIGIAVAASSFQINVAENGLLMLTAVTGGIIPVLLLLMRHWRFQPGNIQG